MGYTFDSDIIYLNECDCLLIGLSINGLKNRNVVLSVNTVLENVLAFHFSGAIIKL